MNITRQSIEPSGEQHISAVIWASIPFSFSQLERKELKFVEFSNGYRYLHLLIKCEIPRSMLIDINIHL